MYLLDTNVISELRRPRAHGAVVAWVKSVADDKLRLDAETFRIWARLMHRRSDTLYEDAMIAATARRHKLIVVTRNVHDFTNFGVTLLNPFDLRPN